MTARALPAALHSPASGDHFTVDSGQDRAVVEASCPTDAATYEIRVQGEFPAELLQRHPHLEVHTTTTETVLHRDLSDLAVLDELLDKLQSLGLALCELREAPIRNAATALTPQEVVSTIGREEHAPTELQRRRCYEVHVKSRTGPALLQSIPWSHRIQGRLSILRARGSSAGLAELVQSLTVHEVTVEGVARLDPVNDRERTDVLIGEEDALPDDCCQR